MVIRMPDKYRRYRNGGGVMSLSERADKQVSRDMDRGDPDGGIVGLQGNGEQTSAFQRNADEVNQRMAEARARGDGPEIPITQKMINFFNRMRELRKEQAQELEGILAANPDRHLWPQYETPDRGMPYSGTADMSLLKALPKEIGREGPFSLRKFIQARKERRGRLGSDRPMTLEGWRGKDWDTRPEHDSRWYRNVVHDSITGLGDIRRASGGIVGFQEGGEVDPRKYPSSSLHMQGQYDPYSYAGQGYQMPADYAAPQSYGGYGMPAQFQQRQEHLSPEVAQQYADLTKGIMRAGTRGYEDVRYKGPQLAGFTGMEAAAQAGAGAYGRGAGPRGTLQSAATISEAATGIGSLVPRQQTMATDYDTMGTGAKALADKSAIAQRGYGTTADTATTTSLKLQREKGLEDYATESATDQRALGTKLGAPSLQKSADLSKYMSQYTAGVTDPQLQQLMEFQRMQGQELGSEAAQAGAFGGLRQGVQAATQAQDVSQQAADIIGKGQQEAFQSAQQAFQADRAAEQEGQRAELAAERGALAAETGQQATQLSAEQRAHQQRMSQEQFGAGQEAAAHQAAIGGYGTQAEMMRGQRAAMGDEMGAYKGIASIGGQQMNLGQQQQAEQMARFDMMNRYGGQQRQIQQAALDMAKAEHQQAMQYPERQIGWMNRQLGALPYQNIVSDSGYAPQVGPLGTTLGAVTGGMEAAEDWRSKQPDPAQPGPLGNLPEWGVPKREGLPTPSLGPVNVSAPPPGSMTDNAFRQAGADLLGWGVPKRELGATGAAWPQSTPPIMGNMPGGGGTTWSPSSGGEGGFRAGGYLRQGRGGGYLRQAPGIIGVGRGMGR